MFGLSICAIVRNEAEYIEEWINFHILQGVGHFFIYDNGSDDGTQDILNDYSDFVTWKPWPKFPGQMSAYRDAIDVLRGSTEWLAVIDIDEFLMSNVELPLYSVLKTFPADVDVVAVHWLLYGSSGHKIKEPGLVIERFTCRAEEVNPHIKSIVRLDNVTGVGNDSHTFRVKGRIMSSDGKELPIDYAHNPGAQMGALRINHYATKSKEECTKRNLLPRADTGTPRESCPEWFDAHDRNEIVDQTALRYVNAVKALLR